MKKLLLFIVAIVTFSLGCFAVDLSPPNVTSESCFTQTEKQSVLATNFDSVQDSVIAENKLIANQKVKAITVSKIETSAESDINKLTAKTLSKFFDLPPNLRDIESYNGNIANNIRADTFENNTRQAS
jgi:hypothetical protein